MLKVFKWLWDKAEEHGREQVLADIHSIRQYHLLESEIAFLKKKYEVEDPNTKSPRFPIKTLLPMEHGAIADEMSKVLQRWHEENKDGW